MTQRSHRIAVIPGDDIGKEVVPEGLRVLEVVAPKHGCGLELEHFDFASYDHYVEHRTMMPRDWKSQIGAHDAPFFGAAGGPTAAVPDEVSL